MKLASLSAVSKRFLIPIAMVLLAATAFAQAPPAPVVSPEVQSDNRVTFRLRAPNAKQVLVGIEGFEKRLPMQKDEGGVWSVTSEPLQPDIYGYSIVVDGVSLIDPSTPLLKPNILFTQSAVHVPGSASLPWEINDVPHGQIHHHFYRSGVVGDQRDFYVYTPPGYDPRATQRYPVLYLLHGFSDDASGWSAVGRANVILDNLIAQGQAKPMLVVMPLGYGAPEILKRGASGFRDNELRDRNFSRFREALLTEVMPRVESSYLVDKDRNARAIAGLSMGGSESLLTGLTTLDKFSWVGAFSSGGLPDEFDKDFPSLDAKANDQLHLLWIACGAEDRLIDINRKLRSWLDSKNVKHVNIETPGMHTWMVWRRNLAEFASLLFRSGYNPSGNGAAAAQGSSMYIHMFAFRWKPGVTQEQKDRAIIEIGKLQGQIPGLIETHVGTNISPRGQGYELGGVMKFADKHSLDTYGPQPVHQKLLSWLMPLIEPIEVDFETAP